ncbi:MAG: choice-of-anchor M domain-containing protein, partial [Propionibacteriaceae bacterium]|nr:choice-of-anchor M domain-containing protein [Propionibacteriaceae bacterium]
MRISAANGPKRWARLTAATWAALALALIGIPAPGAFAADEITATEQQMGASAETAPEPADETEPPARPEQPAEPAPKPERNSPDPSPTQQDPAPEPEEVPAEPVAEPPDESPPAGPAGNQDPQADPVDGEAAAALQGEALTEEEADDLPAGDYPSLPRPAGQSDQPAPASRAKRVLENVHTDAVSAYLDDGKLVAQTKADIDVDGDGAIDLGTRLTTSEVLFHVSDAAKLQVPDVPGYSFLGAPGDTIWMAPMVQDPRVIWPGFSTE